MDTMTATHTSANDARTQYRRPALVIRRAWRATARKIAVCATCAIAISSLIMPSVSFAAEWVSVGDTRYEAGTAAGDDAGTWSWDGANDMQLNGYNGGGIAAGGKLDITLAGNNTVTENDSYSSGIDIKRGASEDAELTITGSGNLDATGGFNGIASEGDINITGTGDVNATGDIDGIHARGDLTIDSPGNVTATSTHESEAPDENHMDGIDVNGDLAIKGGGTVTATANNGIGITSEGDAHISGSTVKATSEGNTGLFTEGGLTIDEGANVTASGAGEGIYSYGRLVIDASIVKALALDTEYAENIAIYTDEGDIYIINGSLVEALAAGPESCGIHTHNWSDDTDGGHITISDSTVKAIAKALEDDEDGSFGIFAATDGHEVPAFIKIIRSNVTASGSNAAIVAIVFPDYGSDDGIDADSFDRGTIQIKDSTIVLPSGGRVVNLDIPVEGPDGITAMIYGQTIGTGGDTITDLNDENIATDMKIEAPKAENGTDTGEATITPAAAPIGKTAKKTTGAKLAATGDNGIVAVGAIAAAGVAAVGTGTVVSRKRKE